MNIQPNPSAVHSFTIQELGGNSDQLTQKVTHLALARGTGVGDYTISPITSDR